jgi:hypothetical protein
VVLAQADARGTIRPGSAPSTQASGTAEVALLAWAITSRQNKKSQHRQPPVRVWLSALALKALALFDIHNSFLPTFSAVDDQISCLCVWTDLQNFSMSASWAQKPSVLYE